MGSVLSNIARVGFLSRENWMSGLVKSRQYPATNANWMKVNVTGYLNWFRMTFPVLDDRADDEYHKAHNTQNLSIDGGALDELSVRLRGPSKRWKPLHQLEDVRVLMGCSPSNEVFS